MDETFEMEYLFGASLGDIKQMDTSLLKGKVRLVHAIQLLGGWNWQPGLLSALFKKFDRYILIGETRALATWLFCVLAWIIGKKNKVFFWTHGWYGKESKLEIVIKKIFLKLPGGGVFLYGNYARDLMIKEGFDPNQLHVIHNSLDYCKHLLLRQYISKTDVYLSHFGNNNKVIIAIGRLNGRKKLHLLLEVVRNLKKKNIIYNVVFVGEGCERLNLEALTKKYGIHQQVWFWGASYDEEKNAELIYNADMCVIPGDIGLTAIHCLTFGTPCITHNNFSHQGPEFEAIYEGMTGSFFIYNSISSLTDTITSWFYTHKNRDSVRHACYKEIDERWTPSYQLNILKTVLLKGNNEKCCDFK